MLRICIILFLNTERIVTIVQKFEFFLSYGTFSSKKYTSIFNIESFLNFYIYQI